MQHRVTSNQRSVIWTTDPQLREFSLGGKNRMSKSEGRTNGIKTSADGLSRRDVLKLGAGAIGGVALTSRSSHGEGIPGPRPTPRRPNIIHIMGDGIQPGQMSAAGNPIIRTPNMDRIANEGVRFQNCFVTNALCAPSRGVILSGQYSRRNGVIDNKYRPIATDVPIFPESPTSSTV